MFEFPGRAITAIVQNNQHGGCHFNIVLVHCSLKLADPIKCIQIILLVQFYSFENMMRIKTAMEISKGNMFSLLLSIFK